MSLSAPATSDGHAALLAYLDVVILVVAAPIMLLIGVPAVGYLVGAGAWIVLRAVGVAIERVVPSLRDPRSEVTLAARLPARAAVHACDRGDPGPQRRRTRRWTDGAARRRVCVHNADAAVVPDAPDRVAPMSKTQKILFACFGAYIGIFILLIAIYGFTQHKNNEFQIQNEFKLVNWVSLGVFSINRAVLYLFIATLLTIFTMVWIAGSDAGAPEQDPDRGRGAVFADAEQHHPGEHARLDGGQVVPVHRHAVPVHLVLQSDRLPAAADEQRGKVQPVRRPHPVVRALRRDREHLGAAGAGTRRVHRVHHRGNQDSRAPSDT